MINTTKMRFNMISIYEMNRTSDTYSIKSNSLQMEKEILAKIVPLLTQTPYTIQPSQSRSVVARIDGHLSLELSRLWVPLDSLLVKGFGSSSQTFTNRELFFLAEMKSVASWAQKLLWLKKMWNFHGVDSQGLSRGLCLF